MTIDPLLALMGWWTVRLFALLGLQVVWQRQLGELWWAVSGTLALSLAGALTLAAPPIGEAAASIDVDVWIRGAAMEATFGGVLGLLAALPGVALLGAAGESPRGLGLGRRSPVEPMILAMVLASSLGLGLHRPLLLGLRELALAHPAGAPFDGALLVELLERGGVALVAALDRLLVVGLALATPVLLTRAVVELGAALCGAPEGQGELRPLWRWVAVGAALCALGASWAAYPEAWLATLGPDPGLARI
ncbi:MAG: hypothetical protein R3B09_14870 [Nannocystaceae bacterium]